MKDCTIAKASLALVLLALSACGSEGLGAEKSESNVVETVALENADQLEAQGIDPCSLLTADEVAAITTDKVRGTERHQQTCKYTSMPADGVEITAYSSGGAKQMETMKKTIEVLGGMGKAIADRGAVGTGTDQAISPSLDVPLKLGDEALWAPNDALAVLKGDAYVEVTPPFMHDPSTHKGYPIIQLSEKKAIVQKVIERALSKLAG